MFSIKLYHSLQVLCHYHIVICMKKYLAHCEFESRSWRCVLDTTLYNKVSEWFPADRWFSSGFLHQYNSPSLGILLKVALSTITYICPIIDKSNALTYYVLHIRKGSITVKVMVETKLYKLFIVSCFCLAVIIQLLKGNGLGSY